MSSNTRTVNNTRRKKPRKKPSILRTIVFYLQIATVLSFGVAIGGICATFITVSSMLPKVTDYTPPEVTRIYSSDDVLLTTVGPENRVVVDIKQIPENLLNATVAIEDSRFYQHGGVDFRGIARATVKNITSGKIDEGGSTITQQLARNVFLTQKRTITRKMREAVLAVMIERSYTKTKILDLYLNQIYYGSNAFGVESASKTYFGKDVKDLDLAECAMLAGLARAPSSLSPHTNLEAAIGRRNKVLEKMEELNYISADERAKARAEKPRIVQLRPSKYQSLAPYFTDYVKQYLRDNPEFNYDDIVYRGGLRIYTTINYQMQEEAQKALTEGVRRARSSRQIDRADGNGALICIEPETGFIRAMVGGADYTDKKAGQYNRAVQAHRQPGSSFKAFVYSAAVDQLGWDANHRITVRTPRWGHYTYDFGDGRTWTPRNYDGKYPGSLTMKQAVALSVNTFAAQTAAEVGLGTVVRYAHLLGVKADIDPYPALSIGGIGGVRPIEMCAAYGVFASGGFYVEPNPIAKITTADGATVMEASPEPKRVLSERTVGVMDELFRAVVTQGTAAWKLRGFPDARGKTGTTNDDRDAWFIGYVPKKLVTAVWMGNDDHAPMNHISGSGLCAPIWKDYMSDAVRIYNDTHKPAQAHKSAQTHSPKSDSGNKDTMNAVQDTNQGTVRVKVCNESQLIATRYCPSWHTETFEKGTEPTEYCNIHGPSGPSGDNGANNDNNGGATHQPPPANPPDQPNKPGGGGDNGGLRITPPPAIPTNH